MAALKEVYQAIKRQKEQFGTYYKACLHLHTPASYDYKLIKDWDDDGYRKASGISAMHGEIHLSA